MSSCSMRLLSCLSLSALLAGCGGGGSATSLPALVAQNGAPTTYSTLVLQINATATSGARRTPLYVSPGTKSVQITITPASGRPMTTTANCASSCSATLQAPVGADQFSVVLYDAQNGQGNVLSRATAGKTIVAAQTNTLNITFGGVIAALAVNVDASTLRSGKAGSTPVNIVPYDAAGYVIVGPAAFTSPIAVALSDPTGATSLSTTVVTSPATVPTLAYNGSSGGANATITVSASGASPASTHVSIGPGGGPTPAPGPAPLHIPDMVYYQGVNANTRIDASWLAQHFTMTQQGSGYSYATAFLNAGGKYAMVYSDPFLVPYCNFPAPYGCHGPIGSSVTNESGWLHDAQGVRLHVISNGTQSNGSWQEAMNPGDPAVQAAFAAYTAAFPGNAVFADDIGGSVDPTPPGYNDYDLYKFGALPQEYCAGMTAAQCEAPSSSYLADVGALLSGSAHPVFTNGGISPENLVLMTNNPNVAGNMLEGCYAPGMSDSTWQSKQNYILSVTAIHRYSLCLSYFQSNLAAERAFNLASYWMVYDGTYAVMWETMTLSSGDQGIMPEYGVVPGAAAVPSSIGSLQRGAGLYVREFTNCAQNGTVFGRCATIVNTGNATVAIPALNGSYSQTMDFSGTTSWYDGGTVQWSSGMPSTIGPKSGVILR